MLSSRAWSSMYTSWNYETGFVWVHFWKIQSSNHPLKTLQKSVFNVLNCTFFSTRRKPGFKSSYQRAGRENHIPLYYNGTPCPIPRVTRIGEIYACQTCVHSRILYFQTQFNPIVIQLEGHFGVGFEIEFTGVGFMKWFCNLILLPCHSKMIPILELLPLMS